MDEEIQVVPIKTDGKMILIDHAELTNLRTLAAQADENARNAERWQKLTEGIEYELSAVNPEQESYWIGKRALNIYYAAKKEQTP